MRILKFTLIAAVLVSFVVLVGIGYVWRELAFTSYTIAPVDLVEQVVTTSVSETISNTSDGVPAQKQASQTVASTSESASLPTVLPEPITVSTGDLPEAQRAILETLGMDGASFTITPEMVACAIDSLGALRVAEIQKGDAPSLSEGLTLIACMKK